VISPHLIRFKGFSSLRPNPASTEKSAAGKVGLPSSRSLLTSPGRQPWSC